MFQPDGTSQSVAIWKIFGLDLAWLLDYAFSKNGQTYQNSMCFWKHLL